MAIRKREKRSARRELLDALGERRDAADLQQQQAARYDRLRALSEIELTRPARSVERALAKLPPNDPQRRYAWRDPRLPKTGAPRKVDDSVLIERARASVPAEFKKLRQALRYGVLRSLGVPEPLARRRALEGQVTPGERNRVSALQRRAEREKKVRDKTR